MFCLRCGNANPAGASFCSLCGAALPGPQQNYASPPPFIPPAGPRAVQEPAAPRPSLQPPAAAAGSGNAPAGLGRRALAAILDTLLIGSLYAAGGMWIAGRHGGVTDSGFSLEGLPALAILLASVLFGFLYFWVLEGLFGTTLGKGVLGIRVKGMDGTRCSFLASLVRNLMRLIDAFAFYLVGFLVAVFSPLRQRLGDRLAKTIVVGRAISIPARFGIFVLWFAVCAIGVSGAYVLHRESPVTESASSSSGGEDAPTAGLRFIRVRFADSESGPARAAGPIDQARPRACNTPSAVSRSTRTARSTCCCRLRRATPTTWL